MSLYLRQGAGFFLQLFPCGLLCFLPFGEESLRTSRRRLFAGLAMAALVLAGLFPLMVVVTEPYPIGSVSHNLYMILAVVLLAAAYFYLLKEPLVKKLLVLYLAVFYAASQYWLVIATLPLLNGGHFSNEIYSIQCLFLYAVTSVVMLPPAVLAFSRVVRDFIREIEARSMKREFFLTMFSTLACFALMVYYSSVADYTTPDFWRLYGPPFLLVLVEQCLVYYLLLRESVRRKRDADHQKAMEIQQLQYENITREMENARRMRHDMRHWLNGLADLLEQDKPEEMKEYLAQVIDRTVKRENTVYCHNPTVNGLLQYYVGQAEGAGIRCLVQAECGDLTILPTDLTVIFGNAMENAIRACRKAEKNRWISIQVGTIGGSLMVQVENPCTEIHPSGRYQLDGGFLPAAAFLSARAGGGYGLGSLEHTARKYGGDARFCYDGQKQTFTTRIRLNLHPEIL